MRSCGGHGARDGGRAAPASSLHDDLLARAGAGCGSGDPGCDVPAPNPSSIPTTARPAAQEHSIALQRRLARPRRAVADARRHADHRAGDETADDAGEGAVHARRDDDAVRTRQIGQRRS